MKFDLIFLIMFFHSLRCPLDLDLVNLNIIPMSTTKSTLTWLATNPEDCNANFNHFVLFILWWSMMAFIIVSYKPEKRKDSNSSILFIFSNHSLNFLLQSGIKRRILRILNSTSWPTFLQQLFGTMSITRLDSSLNQYLIQNVNLSPTSRKTLIPIVPDRS